MMIWMFLFMIPFFFYDFLVKGYLLPLEEEKIHNISDLIPAAFSACKANGSIYAVPQFLCTNLLFGREGDDEILDAENIGELFEVVGENLDDALPPMPDETLLVSIPDKVELAL